jgi:uncharacterized membrane protein YgcG
LLVLVVVAISFETRLSFVFVDCCNCCCFNGDEFDDDAACLKFEVVAFEGDELTAAFSLLIVELFSISMGNGEDDSDEGGEVGGNGGGGGVDGGGGKVDRVTLWPVFSFAYLRAVKFT